MDGRLADRAARRPNRKVQVAWWLGGINEHQKNEVQSYADGDHAGLDLEPLQSTIQEVRSPSRTSDLGQPHAPTVWFFPFFPRSALNMQPCEGQATIYR